MAYNVRYNGLTFVNNPYFNQEWWFLCLKEFSFYEVATNSSSEKYAVRHGEYVNPTQLKNRRIRFLFDIIADSEEERRALLDKVQRAFAPETNPSPFNDKLWKDLSFMDVTWTVRKCKCQIYKWIELSDFANEKWVWISAELITDSSYIKSEQEYSQTITNTLPWIRLPTKLGFSQHYYETIENTWSAVIPIKIIMTILNADSSKYPYGIIKIINDSSYYWRKILYLEDIPDLSLAVWDKIIVDSEKMRVYLENSNGTTDITWSVTAGSERPLLVNWDNIIWIDVGVRDEVISAEVKRNKMF